MNIFASPKKTVDGVMSAFTDAIADLQEVGRREREEAARLEDEAQNLRIRAAHACLEAGRAESISARLSDMLGTTVAA